MQVYNLISAADGNITIRASMAIRGGNYIASVT